MRNLIATIFLAALAGNACAEWTLLTKTDAQTTYADIDNVRLSGTTAKIWMLMDFVTPKPLPDMPSYSSSAGIYEFDCAEQRYRALQRTAYQGQMRQGEMVITSNTSLEWSYVPPGTASAEWLRIVCKKK